MRLRVQTYYYKPDCFKTFDTDIAPQPGESYTTLCFWFLTNSHICNRTLYEYCELVDFIVLCNAGDVTTALSALPKNDRGTYYVYI